MAPKGDTSTKDRKGIFSRIHDRLFEYSYTTRVTVTFALVAMMTVIVAMGVLSYVWEQHFQAYTRENVQELADATAESVAARYEANHEAALDAAASSPDIGYPPIGMDDVQPAQSAHMLQPGMGIQVTSAKDGQVVYDSSLPEGAGAPTGGSQDTTPRRRLRPTATTRWQPRRSAVKRQGGRLGAYVGLRLRSAALQGRPDVQKPELPGHGLRRRAFGGACFVHRFFVRARLGQSPINRRRARPQPSKKRSVGPHQSGGQRRNRRARQDLRRHGRKRREKPAARTSAHHGCGP